MSSRPATSATVLGGELLPCNTEYDVVWEDNPVEEVVEECVTVMIEKCQVEDSRNCTPEYKQTCSKRTKKICRTIKPKVCSPRLKPVISKLRCQPKYTRECDYEWQAKGEVEVLAEITGSCKHVESGQSKCNYSLDDVKKRTVCEKRPKRVCEYKKTKQECKDKPPNVCKNTPVKVCRKEPEVRCENIIKTKHGKISKRVPRTVCR